jgi:hypothetical protein
MLRGFPQTLTDFGANPTQYSVPINVVGISLRWKPNASPVSRRALDGPLIPPSNRELSRGIALTHSFRKGVSSLQGGNHRPEE